ncbi:MAG TPA: glycosyltransferase [Pyrinomonadaceae bacterium]
MPEIVMRQTLPASVIISNYNYGRFLREAVDSALRQTYGNTEVIVVDDGSTDGSREIIAIYGDQITPVLKENGGQASAFNAGFAVSRGDVIFFLDADDMLLPTAVERAVPLFDSPEVAKVHWPLWVVDAQSRKNGQLFPGTKLAEGDLREVIVRNGPSNIASPPTTGNSWSRQFLNRVLPVPEDEYGICADDYLCALAPAFGVMKRIADPQGFYRIHGNSNYTNLPFDEKLRLGMRAHEQQCKTLQGFFSDLRIDVDPAAWKRTSWFHRLRLALEEIAAVIPEQSAFILVDDAQWGTGKYVVGRRAIPFLECDGKYWGPPPDSAIAIEELGRLRSHGAEFIVFAWPSFWWLDFYSELHTYLQSHCRCVSKNDRLIAFKLSA